MYQEVQLATFGLVHGLYYMDTTLFFWVVDKTGKGRLCRSFGPLFLVVAKNSVANEKRVQQERPGSIYSSNQKHDGKTGISHQSAEIDSVRIGLHF